MKLSLRLYGAAAAVLLLAAAAFFPCYDLVDCRPMLALQSPERIRSALLEKAPLGADVAAVDRLIAARGFKSRRSYQLRHTDEPLVFWKGPASGYVSATIGTYRFIWRTDVVAYWVLDEGGGVKEVVVEKQYDAP